MLKLMLNGKYTEIQTVVTHSGRFHADEAYAIALLQVASTLYRCKGEFDYNGEWDTVHIERCSDPTQCNDHDQLWVDIGGGIYDHHQAEAVPPHWNDGTVKASVGRVFDHVRVVFEEMCGSSCVENLIEQVIKPIDMNDTTGYPYVLANIIDAYNDDVTNPGVQDSRFMHALEKATEQIWVLACAGHESMLRMNAIRRSTMPVNFSCGEVIVCGTRVIAEEVSELYPEAVACIYPHERGDYVIRSLPTKNRTPWKAPSQFWGMRGSDALTAWGATFCHKNGFIMGFTNLSDASRFLNTMHETACGDSF